MSRFDRIDLSQLPAPEVVEPLDFEAILAKMVADHKSRNPDFDADELESDPVMVVTETTAYHELRLRNRINNAARQTMLAFATGANLDHQAAFHGVKRKVLKAADPNATPPIQAVMESDDDLRRRVQIAPEALSTAGGEGAYIFNALSAGDTPTEMTIDAPEPGKVVVTYTFDPDGIGAKIKDASAESPAATEVVVTVLGHDGDGTVSAETLQAVTKHLSGKYVRPLTDQVTVQAATITNYSVDATLTIFDGPDSAVLEAAARTNFDKYAEERHAIGAEVHASGIDAALHVAGVKKVTLNGWNDIAASSSEAPFCTGLTLAIVRES